MPSRKRRGNSSIKILTLHIFIYSSMSKKGQMVSVTGKTMRIMDIFHDDASYQGIVPQLIF